MHVGTVKKFLIYSIYLIFVLITFVPRLYVKLHDPNATLPFGFDSFMEILDPVAIATIILATATFALVKDSSKNIEISKNNLLEDHLVLQFQINISIPRRPYQQQFLLPFYPFCTSI